MPRDVAVYRHYKILIKLLGQNLAIIYIFWRSRTSHSGILPIFIVDNVKGPFVGERYLLECIRYAKLMVTTYS